MGASSAYGVEVYMLHYIYTDEGLTLINVGEYLSMIMVRSSNTKISQQFRVSSNEVV